MKSLLIITLLFSFAANAANPAIIFGSGGYAENLAPSGIKLKSGNSLNDDSSSLMSTGGDIIVFKGTNKELELGDEILETASTGLTSPNGMSINGGDNTKFDVAATEGHIVNSNLGTYVAISYAGSTLNSPLVANGVTYVFIDFSGALVTQSTLPTGPDIREKMYLGRVITVGGVVVQTQSEPVVIENVASSLYDMAKAIRIFNDNGNIFTANGTNLNIDKSAGQVFSIGSNYDTLRHEPHRVSVSACTACTFAYFTQAAGSTQPDTIAIDPANYDVAGAITPIGGPTKASTIQRVFLFPSGSIRVAYGQTVYSTLTEAISAVGTQTFIENPNVFGNGILIAFIIVNKAATDLTDPSEARILYTSRFGEGNTGAAGQSISTIQDTYNNSTVPETLLTSATGGITIRDASTPIAAPLFEILSFDEVTNYFTVAADQVTSTSLDINGRLAVTSEALASRPCPIMTEAQRNDIATPLAGDCVYNSTQGSNQEYDGTTWNEGSLPDQTGNLGKVLDTNGVAANWVLAEKQNDRIKNNLLPNPSYENARTHGTLITTGGVDVSTITTRTLQASLHNDKAFRISATAAHTLDYSRGTAGDFTGRQMVAYCEIRTARDDIYFKVFPDGSTELTKVKVSNSDTWQYYRIPFMGEDGPQLLVSSEGNSENLPTLVDNCFLGVSDNETQEIANISRWESYTPTSTQGFGDVTSPDFKWRIVGSSVEINAIFTAGTVTAVEPRISLPNGFTANLTVRKVVGSYERDLANETILSYTVMATGGENFLTFGRKLSTANPYDIISTTAAIASTSQKVFFRATIPVNELSASPSSTIATQSTTLTAETANELSAKINNNGTASIDSTNYSWISSVSRTSLGIVDITLQAGIFTQAPSVTVSGFAGNGYTATAQIINTSTIQIRTQLAGAGLADINFSIKASKQGADVNKDATIIGKFEQIENINSELTAETANSFSAKVSSAGVVSEDTYDFINSNCVITDTSLYECSFQGMNLTQAPVCVPSIVNSETSADIHAKVHSISSTSVFIRTWFSNTTNAFTKSARAFDLICNKGESDTNKSIKGAIISVSDQATRCQTKYLSADVTTDATWVADLAFRNLNSGRFYQIFFQSQTVTDTGTAVAIDIYNDVDLQNNQIGRIFHSTNTGTNIKNTIGNTFQFTAIGSGLSFRYTESGSNQRLEGAGNKIETYATLCELPETVIETTEFN